MQEGPPLLPYSQLPCVNNLYTPRSVIAARRLAQFSRVFGFRQLGKHVCKCTSVCSCVSRSLLTEFIPFHCQVVFHGGETQLWFPAWAARSTTAVHVLV